MRSECIRILLLNNTPSVSEALRASLQLDHLIIGLSGFSYSQEEIARWHPHLIIIALDPLIEEESAQLWPVARRINNTPVVMLASQGWNENRIDELSETVIDSIEEK